MTLIKGGGVQLQSASHLLSSIPHRVTGEHHLEIFFFRKSLQGFSVPFPSLESAGSILCIELPVNNTKA